MGWASSSTTWSVATSPLSLTGRSAERGGEESDRELFEGEHRRKALSGRSGRPPLALHHQSAQTKSSAVAFEENALFQQISLPRLLLFLLLLLFLPLFHCDRVINNQNLILFKHIYVLSINLRQCHG